MHVAVFLHIAEHHGQLVCDGLDVLLWHSPLFCLQLPPVIVYQGHAAQFEDHRHHIVLDEVLDYLDDAGIMPELLECFQFHLLQAFALRVREFHDFEGDQLLAAVVFGFVDGAV